MALIAGSVEEEEDGISIAINVVKVQSEDLATPSSLRKDRAKKYVGDSEWWLRAPWLARDDDYESLTYQLALSPFKESGATKPSPIALTTVISLARPIPFSSCLSERTQQLMPIDINMLNDLKNICICRIKKSFVV